MYVFVCVFNHFFNYVNHHDFPFSFLMCCLVKVLNMPNNFQTDSNVENKQYIYYTYIMEKYDKNGHCRTFLLNLQCRLYLVEYQKDARHFFQNEPYLMVRNQHSYGFSIQKIGNSLTDHRVFLLAWSYILSFLINNQDECCLPTMFSHLA